MKRTAFLTAAIVTGLMMTVGTGEVYAAGKQQSPNTQVKVVTVNPNKNTGSQSTAAGSASVADKLKDYLSSNNGKNYIYIGGSCLPGNGTGGSQPDNRPETPDNNKPDNNKPDNNKPDNNKPDNNKPDNNTPDNNKPDHNNPGTPDGNGPDVNVPDNNNPDSNKPETPDTEDTNQEYHAYVHRVVELVNAERAKAGLDPLTLQKDVTSAAQVRAVETETQFSHTRPNGSSFTTALQDAGVSYRGAGENIAWGQSTPEQVMEGWMNSAGHRANILNESFTSIGVGYYQNAKGVNYWTQLFTS